MNFELDLDDKATPKLQRMLSTAGKLAPLNAEMAMAVERTVRKHFRTVKMLQGNQLRGPSTGFWLKAAASTEVTSSASSANVAIRHPGAALQYFGGTVRPGPNKNWLTIPARSETHGRSAREVEGGYENQEWLYGRNGPWAIASKKSGVVLFWLCTEATIRPHPDVLPTDEEMGADAIRAAEDFFAREASKQ